MSASNRGVTLLASAARTTATTSSDQVNLGWKGVHVYINVSAIVASPGLTITIQGKDELTGAYYTLLTGTQIVTATSQVLKVYPGITAAANASASDVLPKYWRVSVAVADADEATYSISCSMIG